MNTNNIEARKRIFFGWVLGSSLGLLIASLMVLFDPLRIDRPDNLFGGIFFFLMWPLGFVAGYFFGIKIGKFFKNFTGPSIFLSLVILILVWPTFVWGPSKIEKYYLSKLLSSIHMYPGSQLAWSESRRMSLGYTLSINFSNASENDILNYYRDEFIKNGWKANIVPNIGVTANSKRVSGYNHVVASKGINKGSVYVYCGGKPNAGGVSITECYDPQTYPYEQHRVIYFGISNELFDHH